MPDHYGVVLLKSKDGKSVQHIIEKPGSFPIKISSYPNYNKKIFEPYPMTNDKTPFCRKK